MITGLRVGAWWQMRVPIRVGFPASCSGLLDAWVKSVAEWAAAGVSFPWAAEYRLVRAFGLLGGSVHCRRGTRRQSGIKLRESRSPRALLGLRAAVGLGLVAATSLPLKV
jgi:hypothetical protein